MDIDWHQWFLYWWKISSRYFLFASLAFTIFYLLFPRQFARIRIQKLFPKHRDYLRDIGYSLVTMLIFSSIAYLIFIVLKQQNHFYYHSPWQYGKPWYFLSLIWLLLLHDAYFYWIHRLMHLPFFFKRVHLVHHLSTNPSPWTAYAFHPLEAILEASFIIVAAFTIPVHVTIIGFFMLFQIIYNVYGHLGYELYPAKMLKTKPGRWINTGVAHNQHHKHFKGNYGLYTLIWDRMFGTIREDYETSYNKVKTRKQEEPVSSDNNIEQPGKTSLT